MATAADDSVAVRRPGLVVTACGIGFSVFVLFVVHLLNEQGMHVMGWYANAVIPIGALMVGAAAAWVTHWGRAGCKLSSTSDTLGEWL
ncbi:MAG: hypothetical protein QM775_30235 [Pirellulales bacterium]